MQTKDLMTTGVVSVSPATSVSEVADILHTRGFSGLPVVNEDNTVLGVITERELFSQDAKLYLPAYVKILQDTHFVIGGRRELPYVASQLTHTKASDIMNQDMYYARPDTELEELAEAFSRYDQSPIPVTDNNNKLLGIISRSDLVKLLAPAMPTGHHGRLPRIEHENLHRRVIDERLSYVQRDLSSRFAYVARARANIWLTAAVVLFVVGFVLGVIYVADPTIFTEKINTYRDQIVVP
jgi:CBS domain-containing protein